MSKESKITLEQFKLFDALSRETYNIHPSYIEITGAVNYAYLLTQLVFIARQFHYQPFYHTDEMMKQKYGLTRWELLEGRKKLESLGIISTEKRGDGKLYYQINMENLIEKLLLITGDHCRETRQPIVGKPDNPIVGKPDNLSKEENDIVKNDLVNNNNNEKSVDKIEIKTLAQMTVNERMMVDELIKFKLHSKTVLKAVSQLPLSTLKQIIHTYKTQAQKGKVKKSAAAYLSGAISRALNSKLADQGKANVQNIGRSKGR